MIGVGARMPRSMRTVFMLGAIKTLFSAAQREPPPLCFVIAEDAARRQEIAGVVSGLGLRVEQFSSLAAMLEAAAQSPDLTFFDVALGCQAAGQAVTALIGQQ